MGRRHLREAYRWIQFLKNSLDCHIWNSHSQWVFGVFLERKDGERIVEEEETRGKECWHIRGEKKLSKDPPPQEELLTMVKEERSEGGGPVVAQGEGLSNVRERFITVSHYMQNLVLVHGHNSLFLPPNQSLIHFILHFPNIYFEVANDEHDQRCYENRFDYFFAHFMIWFKFVSRCNRKSCSFYGTHFFTALKNFVVYVGAQKPTLEFFFFFGIFGIVFLIYKINTVKSIISNTRNLLKANFGVNKILSI